jgi:RNA polymerase sigma-70 factor (ECF subfamily)
VNRLRGFWRARDYRPTAVGGSDLLDDLNRLEDPSSELSRAWDEEHDRHVIGRLLATVRGEFQPATWEAFEAVMLRGESAANAATRLNVSVNAVLLAKSRVLRRLRQEGRDLLDGLPDS